MSEFLQLIKLHPKIPCKKRQAIHGILHKKQNGLCYWCGCRLSLFHSLQVSKKKKVIEIDHIIPRRAGGSNSITNLVGCCKECNNKRARLFHNGFFLFIILNQETPEALNSRYGAQKRYKEMNHA